MVVTFITFTMIMIEYAIPSKDIRLIVGLGVVYFGVSILRAIVTFFEDLNDAELNKSIEADYREKIYIKLQNTKQSELDRIRVGEILENIINDTKEFARWYGVGICRSYLAGVVRLVGTLAVLMYLNVPIVMIAFAIYLLGFAVTHIFNKKSISYTSLKRKINAKILNWSNEQVQGYSTIKALEIEQERLAEIKSLLVDYEDIVNKLEKNIRVYTCLYNFIVSFVGVTNILIGAISVESGIISYGAMIVLARYISSPETYARWVIEGFQIRNVGRLSYNRICDILNMEEEDVNIGEKIDCINTVEFENVSFSYPKGNLGCAPTVSVNKNESVALIGRTGSGKTSLVNLLCRFYDLNDGVIRINGVDYKNYSIQSLRNKIGYIMQKVVIFDGTIFDNINYANKDVSKNEIMDICKRLGLHDKIMMFENGYETRISADTDIFSSGEKQLLNFARVMVEDPDIIILDEATASLSYRSEMLVRKAIDEITQGKISFIIAHRLSTIKKCDKILLMKDGKVIEEGRHDELVEKQGEYYSLINMGKGD